MVLQGFDTLSWRRMAATAALSLLLLAPVWSAHADAPDESRDQTEDAAGDDEIDADLATILELEGNRAFGAYLGGECVTCHRPSGASPGVPPITGLEREHFIRALLEYRANIRTNEVMTTTAARLSDEEIAALAAHFSAE